MLTKEQLQRLAERRMAEALALMDAGHWSGAYYLAGYVAEMGLKAVVAGQFVANAIPDRKLVNSIYTHDIFGLVQHAGLNRSLELEAQRDSRFALFWESVKRWREDSRYQEWSQDDAKALVEAIADERSGLFRWIRTHW